MAKLRSFSFPQELEKKIWNELEKLGCDPDAISRIKDTVIRLSDHFIGQKAKSPLSERWAQIAYLSYYFPMNYLRARAVCEEADRLGFFQGLSTAVDIGSGMGSLTLNLLDAKSDWQKLHSIDVSKDAVDIQRQMISPASPSVKIMKQHQLLKAAKIDLACLSYSWNEFSETEKADFLNNLENFQALMIIEPSTQLHARNLMALRAELLKKGFYAWGPCTHQAGCPLLVHSKTDWCHDRIEIKKTQWQKAIEKQLPFKNETLTFSYLLMRRTKPNFDLKEVDGIKYQPTRVIGDELIEKGKNRQAICRSNEREFFAWFPQRVKHNIFNYTHGELAFLNTETQKKSNELRINEKDVIKQKF